MSSRHQIFSAAPFLVAAVVASGVLGCSVQPPAKEPLDAGVTSPDDAEAAFESAEQDLQSVLLAGGVPTPGRDDAGGADGTGQPGANGEHAVSKQAKRRSVSRCTRACKALASMQRSATRLCDMTGQEDPRCQNVSHRVAAAQNLVRSNCPNCSE